MASKRSRLYMELVGVVILCATAIIYFSIHQTTLLTLVHGFPPLPSGEAWQQQFDDEFAANSLNASYWVTCYDWFNLKYNGCSNTSNHEEEWYVPSQVNVHRGYVQLTAAADPVKGLSGTNKPITYPYRSGMISTGRENNSQKNVKQSFLYGFFEARIRVTSGKGIWPAFWLQPANKSWPPEIDIMELYGDQPQDVMMAYHWGTWQHPQQDQTTFAGLHDYNDWHTYGVNWEPGHLDWYVDGVLRKSVTGTNVPSQPMEMIVNLAIGGTGPGNPDHITPLPAHMDVDYVRVYKPVLKSS